MIWSRGLGLCVKLHNKRRAEPSWPCSWSHVRGFYGDAALLLVFARVCEARLSSPGWGDDPRLGHQWVGQRGLPMVHVGYHRHVSDVGLFVHDGTDLVHSEVHLLGVDIRGVAMWVSSWQTSSKKGSCYSSHVSICAVQLICTDVLSGAIKRKTCLKLNLGRVDREGRLGLMVEATNHDEPPFTGWNRKRNFNIT